MYYNHDIDEHEEDNDDWHHFPIPHNGITKLYATYMDVLHIYTYKK